MCWILGDVYTQLDNHVRFYKPDGAWRMRPDNSGYLDIPGFPEDISTQVQGKTWDALLSAMRFRHADVWCRGH
jgi:hypothetical protein